MKIGNYHLYHTRQNGDSKTAVRPLRNGFLSPFRYPGGKSWFIQIARKWLKSQNFRPKIIVEPFAGGAGVSLTAVHENLVNQAAFGEIDSEVAATWKIILNGESKWLVEEIKSFQISRKKVEHVLGQTSRTLRRRAFRCLLHNRTSRGGVITKGAGLIRKGEDGKGLSSRWYPDTLAKRIKTISSLKSKLIFTEGDGFNLIRKYMHKKEVVFFVDPPYTRAASRLYNHWEINHEDLFKILSRVKGKILMTYDDTVEIRKLSAQYGFQYKRISMQTTHHKHKRELMISNDFSWQKKSKSS